MSRLTDFLREQGQLGVVDTSYHNGILELSQASTGKKLYVTDDDEVHDEPGPTTTADQPGHPPGD